MSNFIMNPIEAFVLAGSGYVCGLATSTGFILSALLQIYVQGKSSWRMLAWMAYMIANTFVASLTPIFLIGALVVADKPGRLDFWPRAGIFAIGLVIGICFIFFSAYLINARLKKNRV